MSANETIAVKDVTVNPQIREAGYSVHSTDKPGLWMVRNHELGEDVFLSALQFQQFIFQVLQISANQTQAY